MLEFVFQSTLQTATGLVVIVIWLGLGYLGTELWYDVVKRKFKIEKRSICGSICGPITFVVSSLVAFSDATEDVLT